VRRLAVLLAVPTLLLAACGDDSTSTVDAFGTAVETTGTDGTSADSTVDTGSDEPAVTTTTEPVEAADDSPALDAVTVTGEFGVSAELTFEQPFSVDETVRRVLTEGDGAELVDGITITFAYTALNGRDGTVFDTSYGTGATPSAALEVAQIIPGIVKGLLGTHAGSRVLVAIPPADAFGPQGGIADAGIEADDTILFLVDVIDARVPLERAEGTPVDPVDGLPTVELDEAGAPTITMPDGDPPAELVTQPLIVGDGAVVESGQTLTVHYTGAIYATGEVFDSSWETGSPANFAIGVAGVIPGWDTGLVGQTVGSQVLLVIPPDQGYGAEGQPAAGISGTDTLVFVVDILDAS
jgi:peptidylprolyl isomerase